MPTVSRKIRQNIERLIYPLFSILVLIVLDIVWLLNSLLSRVAYPEKSIAGVLVLILIGCPVTILMGRWIRRLNYNKIWQIFLVWIVCCLLLLFIFSVICNAFLDYFSWLDSVSLFILANIFLAFITCFLAKIFSHWVDRQEFNGSAIIRKVLLGMNVLVILRMIAVLSVKDKLELGSVVLSTGAYKNWDLLMITGPLITIVIPVFIGLCFLMQKECKWDFSSIEWVYFWLSLINGMIVWTDSAYFTLIRIFLLCGVNIFGN